MIENDLKYLEIDYLTYENIKTMKKLKFRKLVKQQVEIKTLEKLENLKLSHSKVKNIEHMSLVMQKYLQPNSSKISKDDAQLIFKLRCRVTNVKTNMKGKYEKLECRACNLEEESQKHIMECKILNHESDQKLEYEKVFNGTVSEKLKIAKKFRKNIEKLEEENSLS